MSLAEALGKSISEVNDLPRWELPLWAAWNELKAEETGNGGAAEEL